MLQITFCFKIHIRLKQSQHQEVKRRHKKAQNDLPNRTPILGVENRKTPSRLVTCRIKLQEIVMIREQTSDRSKARIKKSNAKSRSSWNQRHLENRARIPKRFSSVGGRFVHRSASVPRLHHQNLDHRASFYRRTQKKKYTWHTVSRLPSKHSPDFLSGNLIPGADPPRADVMFTNMQYNNNLTTTIIVIVIIKVHNRSYSLKKSIRKLIMYTSFEFCINSLEVTVTFVSPKKIKMHMR